MSTRYQATCDTCGHTTTSKTQGLAEHGLRTHNCAKQQALNERAAKHAAHMATVDRTPKPCHHKQANHQHGTHACYVLDRCRCRPCADAAAAYERNRTRQHAYGRFDQKFVDGDTVRAHIETLRAAGIGWKRIARIAGVPNGTMWKLIYGVPSTGRPPSKRVRAETAAKILAVTPDPEHVAGGAVVDGTGTRRRLQALIANGWSQTRLAALLDWQTGNLNTLILDRNHGQVKASTARAVRDLYEQLWDQAPPVEDRWQAAGATRARNVARQYGWAPPMAWDDIDDAAAQPVGVGKVRAHRSPDEVADEVEHHLTFVDRLATFQQVAERLGYANRDSIRGALIRGDRPDLLELLDRNTDLAWDGRRHKKGTAA